MHEVWYKHQSKENTKQLVSQVFNAVELTQPKEKEGNKRDEEDGKGEGELTDSLSPGETYQATIETILKDTKTVLGRDYQHLQSSAHPPGFRTR